MRASAEDRLWASVDRSGECWLYVGSYVHTDGYALFYAHGRRHMAHRFVYELLVGSIPEGHEVDHLCKVRNCVNPAHLEAVTPRVNNLRSNSVAATNATKTHCVNGHAFTPENTYIYRGKMRTCRTCNAERVRKRYRRKTAADA